MADRGFVIYYELKELGVVLNIPCFLAGRDQLTAAEVKESQSIASVRIHVKRSIQRVKKFRMLRNEIPFFPWLCEPDLDSLLYVMQFYDTVNSKRQGKWHGVHPPPSPLQNSNWEILPKNLVTFKR